MYHFFCLWYDADSNQNHSCSRCVPDVVWGHWKYMGSDICHLIVLNTVLLFRNIYPCNRVPVVYLMYCNELEVTSFEFLFNNSLWFLIGSIPSHPPFIVVNMININCDTIIIFVHEICVIFILLVLLYISINDLQLLNICCLFKDRYLMNNISYFSLDKIAQYNIILRK